MGNLPKLDTLAQQGKLRNPTPDRAQRRAGASAPMLKQPPSTGVPRIDPGAEPSTETAACRSCSSWASPDGEFGECRHEAPKMVTVFDQPSAAMTPAAAWPGTPAFAWCRKYDPRHAWPHARAQKFERTDSK